MSVCFKLKFHFLLGEKTENISVDYQLIVSIIQESSEPLTVSQILQIFKNKYGYDFTSRYAYRSCMDYFRLYPNIFNVSNKLVWSNYNIKIKLPLTFVF